MFLIEYWVVLQIIIGCLKGNNSKCFVLNIPFDYKLSNVVWNEIIYNVKNSILRMITI